jgi:hypothetical protein
MANEDQTLWRIAIAAAVIGGAIVLYNMFKDDPDARRAVDDAKSNLKSGWREAKGSAKDAYHDAKANAREATR